MSKAKHIILPYNKINLESLEFTEIQDNDRAPTQRISYFRYRDSKRGEGQFNIQTPEILMDNYGIPDADLPYYKTIASRAFIKIPLNETTGVEYKNETSSDKEIRINKLENFKVELMKIDDWMESNKEKIFGSSKKANLYKYQPIVRKAMITPDDSDSDGENEEEKKPKLPKPDFMKAKIQLDYHTNAVLTEIYQKNEKDTEKYEDDGPYSKIDDIESLDDLKKYIGYMRKYKFVLHAAKIWANKQATNGQTTRAFGIMFKVRRIEMRSQPNLIKPIINNEKEENPFVDSDDEEEQIIKKFVEENKDLDDESKNIIEEEDETQLNLEEEDNDKVKPKKGNKGKGRGKTKAT